LRRGRQFGIRLVFLGRRIIVFIVIVAISPASGRQIKGLSEHEAISSVEFTALFRADELKGVLKPRQASFKETFIQEFGARLRDEYALLKASAPVYAFFLKDNIDVRFLAVETPAEKGT